MKIIKISKTKLFGLDLHKYLGMRNLNYLMVQIQMIFNRANQEFVTCWQLFHPLQRNLRRSKNYLFFLISNLDFMSSDFTIMGYLRSLLSMIKYLVIKTQTSPYLLNQLEISYGLCLQKNVGQKQLAVICLLKEWFRIK